MEDDIDFTTLIGSGVIHDGMGKAIPAVGHVPSLTPTDQWLMQGEIPAPSSIDAAEKETAADHNFFTQPGAVTGIIAGVGVGFNNGGNFAVDAYRDASAIVDSGDVDPGWRGTDKQKGTWAAWAEKNAKDVSQEDWWRFSAAKNQEHAQAILDRQRDDSSKMRALVETYGVSGIVGASIAGILDVDTIAGMAVGAGPARLIGKGGRLASAIASGASAGAVQGGDYFVNPNADWRNIPLAAAGGAAFGTLLYRAGKAVPDDLALRANELAAGVEQKASADIGTPMKDTTSGSTYGRQLDDILASDVIVPDGKPMYPVDESPSTGAGSLSAANSGAKAADFSDIKNPESVRIIQHAESENASDQYAADWNSARAVDRQDRYEKAMNYVKEGVNAVLPNDFARMMNSGSEVAKHYATKLLADATGIVTNNRNAAQLKDLYRTRMRMAFSPYNEMYESYVEGLGGGYVSRTFGKDRAGFDKQIVMELQARKYGGALSTDPLIKQAADAVDKTFELDVHIGKGDAGEVSRFGYDALTPESGYFPQHSNGVKAHRYIGELMNRHGINKGAARKMVVDALTEFWTSPTTAKRDASIWAEAWTDRTLRNERGVTSNLIDLLQEEGESALVELLARQPGVTAAEAAAVVKRLVGKSEQRGMAGHLKQRLDIDLRVTASNGVEFASLIDLDVVNIVHRRIESGSGMAALARHGITSKSDFNKIKDAILDEQQSLRYTKGNPRSAGDAVKNAVHGEHDIDQDFMNGLWKYFAGEQLISEGQVSAWRRIRQATQAVLLSQNGLAQMAEYGPVMAAMGARNFAYSLPHEIQQMLSRKDSPLMQELRKVGAFVPEERLHRGVSDHVDDRTSYTADVWSKLDRGLTGALQAQADLSGLNFVRNSQQRMMTSAFASRIGELAQEFLGTAKPGELVGEAFRTRMHEFGIDSDFTKLVERNHKYMKYDKGGDLVSLGTEHWTQKDLDDYVLASNKYRDTHVQRAIEGHSHMLFHADGLVSLLAQFKSYPIQAIMRQFYREGKYGDGQTAAMLIYGSAIASFAYIAKQGLNMRSEDTNWVDAVKGGIGMSSMIGWMPMLVDPVTGALGFDDLRFSSFARDGQVLTQPASLSAMNKLLRLASVPADVLTGRMDHNTVMALKAVPVVGNMPVMAGLLNKWADSLKD